MVKHKRLILIFGSILLLAYSDKVFANPIKTSKKALIPIAWMPYQNPVSHPSSVDSIIIPLYSYPVGQYAGQWQKLYNFNTNKKVYVILNVSNGPGSSLDPNFVNAIETLKAKGFKIIGYVYTSYGARSLSDVESDINTWINLYGSSNMDGFFLDEVSTNNYNYYQTLYKFIKSLNQNYLVILNPGTNVSQNYFSIADKIVVYEDSYQNFLNYNYSYFFEPSSNVCVIVYDTSNNNYFYNAESHGFSINSSCQYITDYSGSNTYFYLSDYLNLF